MMGLEAEELWVCPRTSKDLGKSFAFSGTDILITGKDTPAFCMSKEMMHMTECCELWRANSYRGWLPPCWVLIIHSDCWSSDTHVTESEAWIWIYDVQRIHRLLSFLCKLVTYSKIAPWFHLLLTYLLIKISSVALILSINILMNERWALSSKISQMKLKMCLFTWESKCLQSSHATVYETMEWLSLIQTLSPEPSIGEIFNLYKDLFQKFTYKFILIEIYNSNHTEKHIICVSSANFLMLLERKWKSPCRVQLSVTPWSIQSVEFSRPEYWNGLAFPSSRRSSQPRDHIGGIFFTSWATREALNVAYFITIVKNLAVPCSTWDWSCSSQPRVCSFPTQFWTVPSALEGRGLNHRAARQVPPMTV